MEKLEGYSGGMSRRAMREKNARVIPTREVRIPLNIRTVDRGRSSLAPLISGPTSRSTSI